MVWQKFFANCIGNPLINIDDYDKNHVKNSIFLLNKKKYIEYKKNYLTLREDNKVNSELIREKLEW